ncbi:DUF5305 domain-containing protein [Halosimplex salinum]|uniref:DUF5305 domain-containing protein n=1 Tax=Halosimplex salinum TaxID=1710538 RepID=UPI000F4A8710|nr:DUF5305 domain-containing protein [Halosimplex salinum]
MSAEEEPSTADRVRHACSTYFTLFVAASLLLAVGGVVVAADTHTGPDATTEQRTVGTWSTDSGFHHAAVVQRDVRPFDRGEVLRNRSTYFSTVTPVLNGTYEYEHDGAESARVSTDLTLVVRAVSRAPEGGVLWQERERVASETAESLPAGDEHRVPFEVNVTERIEYGRAVRDELGTVRGRIEVLVVAETESTTTLGDDSLADERTERIEITPESGTYDVALDLSGQRDQPVSEAVSVPVDTDPVRAYGSLLAVLVGVLGAGALVWADRDGRLDVPDHVRSAIAVGRERDSFDEWISTGRVPPVGDDRVVTVDSLADLVDVAIDSDRRVIEDAEAGTFVVLDGPTRYEYRPENDDQVARPDGRDGAIVSGPVGGGATENGDSEVLRDEDEEVPGDEDGEVPSADE